MNKTVKAELPALVKQAGDEILDKKRAEVRERAKVLLKRKDKMEHDIAECEKDLEKARTKLAEFAAKLAEIEGGTNLEAFEELEKIVSDGDGISYIPGVQSMGVRITYSQPYMPYVTTGYVTSGNTSLAIGYNP